MAFLGENQETLEEMAATVAHEIKNPLNVALAHLDLIKTSDTEGKYNKNCEIIKRELFKINQLVLDFIHSAREDEKEELIDLTAMLSDLVDEYRRTYEHMVFDLDPTDEALQFSGQRQKIRMVFTNLLSNAVESMSFKGCIDINVETTDYDIAVVINDNGTGLKDASLLDQSFFTTKQNGTGFGLHYCRNTVAQYGGRFTLENRPEGGCSAIVELPRRTM
ncbi:MAG: HAMP domain-containing histidine kinase [Clostridiales bacterium]|jgi:signal transduction histidine kinase|nr:HAMP domain-containing histidine kinase [Clostridiales bacterium]